MNFVLFIKNIFNRSRCCFIVFLIVSGLFVCCSNPTKQEASNTVSIAHKDTIHQKPPSSFSDTTVIDSPSAVFYNPDSIQLEKIKLITDTAVFESAMHDCFYQMRYSRTILQQNWPGVKIVEINNARYILFNLTKGEKEYIDLNTHNDPCGIFIFDGKKRARLVDMTNIDSELGFYFSDK